jgi:hypothetical protein
MMVRYLMVGVSKNFVIPSEARNLSAVLIRAQKQRRDFSLRSE